MNAAAEDVSTPIEMEEDDDDMGSVMYSGSDDGNSLPPPSYASAINKNSLGRKMQAPKLLLPIQGMDLVEHIEYLIVNQSTSIPHSSYLQVIEMGRISVTWRRKFTEYIFTFIEDYHLDPLTISTAINYLDRFLSLDISSPCVAPSVAGITCVLIASKFVDVNAITLDDLVQLPFVTGTCTAAEFIATESKIVSTLNWCLNPVTSHRVGNAMMALFDLKAILKEDAMIGKSICI